MLSKTRILLIDDDAIDRAAVRRALRAAHAEVVEATDGATGIEQAQQAHFDCVLLDYHLPDMSAFEIIEKILAGPNDNQAILMLTGEVDPEIASSLLQAGALEYLSKIEATPATLSRAIRFVKARREALTALETARREAEEKSHALQILNNQKNLLFSIIAHDLRNPFQVLLSLSQLLKKSADAKDVEKVARQVDGIQDAATRAHALMEGLFAWAGLQRDTTEVATAEVEFHTVAEEALALVADAADKKGIVTVLESNGISLSTNQPMLAAVLRNLINNSIKFTCKGGIISVRARTVDEGIEVSVADTGTGMSEEIIADLFRLDRRTTTTGTAGEQGSGLGLLLCRDLVERLNGTLKVESTVGVGTTFTMLLPATP